MGYGYFFYKTFEKFGYFLRAEARHEGLNPLKDIAKVLAAPSSGVALDIGANVGQSSQAICRVFPQLRVHAFEPVEMTFLAARENLRSLPQVTLTQAAMGEKPGEVVFFSSGTAETASLNSSAPREGFVPNRVAVLTVDGYCRENGIDRVFLLKTDTEGFEMNVLNGAREMLASGKVDFVLIEVGFNRSDSSHTWFCTISPFLEDLGFTLFNLYDIAGLWHHQMWGSTFGNALFYRSDLLRPTGVS